jgi:hypothetical protein
MTAARIAVLVTLGGCGGGSSSADAPPDIDNGTCGPMLRFSGDYLDWDTDITFCGLPGSTLRVRDTGMQFMITAPNGRIDMLCVPDQSTSLIDITPPSAVPGCKADKTHQYRLPGIAVANKAVILAGGFWSGRTFAEGVELFDTTKAQVYVHVVGPARAVSLNAPHDAQRVKAVMTNTWELGNSGHEVFIPDVDPSGGSATLSVAGGAIGAGSIPLVAGKMTTLTVITQ